MNKLHENKLTMYVATDAVLKSNADLIAKIPAFKPALHEFDTTLAQIKSKANEIDATLAGTTANKHTAKKRLFELIIKISAALMTIAHRTQNNVLTAKSKITKSELNRLRDTDLTNRATALHSTALEQMDALKDFSILPADLTAFKDQIAVYSQALGSREERVASHKAAYISLNALFTRMDQILKSDLDKLMELVKTEAPEFYDTYFAARAIKRLGHRSKPVTEPPATE